MKVTIDRKDKETDKPFPKLMIRGGDQALVYFYARGDGFRIWDDIIKRCTTWPMTDFKDFRGTVTLEND